MYKLHKVLVMASCLLAAQVFAQDEEVDNNADNNDSYESVAPQQVSVQSEQSEEAEDNDGYEVMTSQQIDEMLNSKERQARLKKIDQELKKMAAKFTDDVAVINATVKLAAGGTLSAEMTALAAYGLLKVTAQAGDKVRDIYKISINGNADGTTSRMGCDDKKKQIGTVWGTIGKQVGFMTAISVGAVKATKEAKDTKNMLDLKYATMATKAVALATPEAVIQAKVMKWAKNEVKSCKDGGN